MMSRSADGTRRSSWLTPLVIGTAFLVDLLVVADINVAVFYAVAVVMAARSGSLRFLTSVAVLSLALLLLAILFGPAATESGAPEVLWLNRVLTLTIIIVIALLAHSLMRRTSELIDARSRLEAQVDERSRRLEAEAKAREELEHRLSHATQLEALGRMSGEAAHDLRNVLTAVTGNLDLLSRRLKDQPHLQRYVERADQGAQRAADQAERMLSLVRQRRSQPEPVSMAEMLDGMRDMLAQAVGTQVRLVCSVDDGAAVHADRQQLELALLNLCVNARDAMPSGGTLEVCVRKDSPRFTLIQVRDEGTGMNEETRRRAAEAFYTTKEEGRGTGLGLATVSDFVSKAGGRLKIDSAPGAGTRISFWLPVQAPSSGNKRLA
jgi:signal transduction histidine kinase